MCGISAVEPVPRSGCSTANRRSKRPLGVADRRGRPSHAPIGTLNSAIIHLLQTSEKAGVGQRRILR
jgi:hypothetical protein